MAAQCSLYRALRRRKHHLLVVTAVYAFCSIGMAHLDFPFRFIQSSRGMQAEYLPTSKENLLVDSKGVSVNIRNKGATISKAKRIKWERERFLSKDNQWNENNPIFVFNLPGPGTQTAVRYFECSFGGKEDIALYWAKIDEATSLLGTPKRSSTNEIGMCFQNNLQKGNSPLEGCGKAKVWASMGYASSFAGKCFYPSMDPAAMDALVKTYPKATILQVIQDPDQWYESSYPKFRTNLATSCQDLEAPIPGESASRSDWISFYKWHEASVRDFAKAHPSLQYVEVALDDAIAAVALKRQFGLPSLCWQPPKRLPNRLERSQEQEEKPEIDPLPVDRELEGPTAPPQMKLPYPIFVASLPKSGTTSTQRFFQCGLGYEQAGHHWTQNKTTDVVLKIGKCMEYNMQRNRSIFEDCGNFKVWTDTGYLDEKTKQNDGEPLGCFFPTMQGGLEAFYRSHPNGTIMSVVRDAAQWYESAMKWRKLPKRMSKYCSGFPPPLSSAETWHEFYRWHTQHVRDFALQHPSLTYVEVSLESNETGEILENHTGIPDFCWGDCNPNRDKPQCGVLKKMYEYKMAQYWGEEESRSTSLEEIVEGDNQMGQASAFKGFLNNPKWAHIERKFNQYQNTPVQAFGNKIPALN